MSGLGSTIGGIGGALVGGAPGARIGSSLGSGVESAIKAGRANRIDIPDSDPLQTMVLNDLQRKLRAIEVGSFARASQDAIAQSAARSKGAVTRTTSGNIGATVAGLQRIQSGEGRSINDLQQNLSLQGLRLQQQVQQQANLMAQRKRQLQEFEQDRLYAQSAAAGQSAMQNTMALGARGELPSLGGVFQGNEAPMSSQNIGAMQTLPAGPSISQVDPSLTVPMTTNALGF